MAKEYYQVGWTLGEEYADDYYATRDNNKYFIKRNATPILSTLSAEKIVPKVRWSKRLSNGDVLIAQDFENGKTLSSEEMRDKRIPKILKKVHSSKKLKKMMITQGYREETAENLLFNLEKIMTTELLENSNIAMAFSYLKRSIPKQDDFCLCHADLQKENWLLSDKNGLFLVDWDQAILGDPAIDISFVLYRYIDQANWDEWLKDYGITSTLEYRLKLKWYITFQALVLVIWNYEKRRLSEMNEWLVFINKIFFEYV
ncbi:MAG: phosphotransferase family protein [Gemella sp.]|nr:phosphotransferase family protein [Gemella sp.]